MTDSIQYQLLELILAQKIALYRFSSQLKTFGGFNEDTIDGFGLKIVKPDDSYSWIEKQILKAITKNKSSKYPFSLAKKVIPDTIDFYFGDRMAYLHPHKTLAINFIQKIALEEEWLRYEEVISDHPVIDDGYFRIYLEHNKLKILSRLFQYKEEKVKTVLSNCKDLHAFVRLIRTQVERKLLARTDDS
ncbi:MAG: hypothetical protein AAF985_09870 [Bacteroidota bacterium]